MARTNLYSQVEKSVQTQRDSAISVYRGYFQLVASVKETHTKFQPDPLRQYSTLNARKKLFLWIFSEIINNDIDEGFIRIHKYTLEIH